MHLPRNRNWVWTVALGLLLTFEPRVALGQSATCGDGVVEGAEECDDANILDGDCCTRACRLEPEGSPCDDGTFCTALDVCVVGVCTGTTTRSCEDDGVGCTDTFCDPVADACVHIANDAVCDDGLYCNGSETCNPAAGCQASPSPVDCGGHANACRQAYCDEGVQACALAPVLGEFCDGDGDGLSLEDDPCPNTPHDARMVISGCSSVDILRDPTLVLGPVAEQLAETLAALENDPRMDAIASQLEHLRPGLGLIDKELRQAKVCVASTHFGTWTNQLSTVMTSIEATAAGIIGVDPTVDPWLLGLEVHLVKKIEERALLADDQLDQVCEGVVGHLNLNEVIAEIDDSAGLMLLDNGLVVTLFPTSSKKHVASGSSARFNLVSFGDGTAGSLGVPTPLGPPPPKLGPGGEPPPFECLDLMVVPYQSSLLQPHERVRYPLIGYFTGAEFTLEKGMLLTAELNGNCAQGGSTITEYSFRLQVIQGGGQPLTMAEELLPGEMVAFPAGVNPFLDATLKVTARSRECTSPSSCGPLKVISYADDLPVQVHGTGSLCTFEHEDAEVQLEDVDFQLGQNVPFPVLRQNRVPIHYLAPHLQFDSPEQFVAGAYSVNGETSLVPITVSTNDVFAMYQNHDFWPVRGPSSFFGKLLAKAAYGVNGPIGLQWPHIEGVNNGSPVRYHCKAAFPVIRDGIACNFLDGSTPYRLPFTQGNAPLTKWVVGFHGNCSGAPDCWQEFSYDFGSPVFGGAGGNETTGDVILAARGGTVEFVIGNLLDSDNCELIPTPPSCFTPYGPGGNQIWILHSDGTYAVYAHLRENGVEVVEEQQVRRGQRLGLVGQTGAASNVHFHFDVRKSLVVQTPLGEQSLPIRFDMHTFPQSVVNCRHPLASDPLLSNNPLYPPVWP